jgi:hypothetical protein
MDAAFAASAMRAGMLLVIVVGVLWGLSIILSRQLPVILRRQPKDLHVPD